MKRKLTLAAFASMFLAWGCTDAALDDIQTQSLQSRSLTVSTSTTVSADVRALITEEDDIWVTSWIGDEEIYGLDYTSGYFNTMYLAEITSEDNKKATFACDDFQYDADSDQVRFIYPASAVTEDTGTFYINFTEQEYDITADDNKEWIAANTMYMMSDYVSYSDIDAGASNATFKHLSSVVTLNITPTNFNGTYTISRIEIDAPQAYGKYTVSKTRTFETDNIYGLETDINPSVILPNSSISSTENTEVLISMPPFTVADGQEVSIIVTLNDGTSDIECIATKTNESGAELSFAAGLHHTLNFDLDPANTSSSMSLCDYHSMQTIDEGYDMTTALFDGDADSFFHSGWASVGSVADPHWMTVDLGKDADVQNVILAARDGRTQTGFIETSSDNSNWQYVGNFSVTGNTLQTVAVVPTTARYVKVSVTNDANLQFAEFSYNSEAHGLTVFSAKSTSYELSAEGGDITVELTYTEEEPSYYVSSESIVSLKSKDTESNTYVFTIAENTSSSAASPYIVFTLGDNATCVVSISQEGAVSGTVADNTTFSIYDFSTQEEVGEASGTASSILDGDTSTYWHSVWYWSSATGYYDATGQDHYVIIDLNGSYTIDNVYLSPRSTSGSHVNEGVIYTSADAVTWTEQASYSIGYESKTAIAMTTSMSSRYVKVTSTSSYAMISEFNISYTAGTPNVSYLDRSTWTVEASSEETAGEGSSGFATCMLDGDSSTYWHSQWYGGSTGHPYEFVFYLGGGRVMFNGLYISARSGWTSRVPSEMLVEYSNNASSWYEVGTYTTSAIAGVQKIDFGVVVEAVYLRVTATATAEGGDDASIAEFGLYYDSTK